MPASRKTPRVALYGRVSTNNQDVELQLQELREVASQRGWDIVGEFKDEGISGSSRDRQGLQEMLNTIRGGKVDVVAVWKIDRLGRSLQHLLQILDELALRGVDFVAIRNAGLDSTSAQGRLMLQILGAFCEYEAELIRERVRAGVARAKANGKRCGRPRRELDLRAAHLLLEQGHSQRRVAEMLDVPRGTLRRRLTEAAEAGSKTHPSPAS